MGAGLQPGEARNHGAVQRGARQPGSSFQVRGTPAQSGGVELSLGVGGQMSETVSWSLEYTGEFRSDTSGHLLQGRLSVAF